MKVIKKILALIIWGLLLAGQAAWSEDNGFISFKGAKFELGGELEWEFVDTNSDQKVGGINEPDAHFQVDKLVLSPKVTFGDYLSLKADCYIQEGGASLNEFHAKFTKLDLPGNMWLDMGLYERWAKSHAAQPTEGYPLLSTAFWRDDANTVTLGGEYESVYWMLSVGNGFSLDTKQPAEDSSYKLYHDNHSTSNFRRMETGIHLGFTQDFEDAGAIDIMVFSYTDDLSDADIAKIQGDLTSYTSNKRNKNRTGLGLEYQIQDFRFYGQYVTATDGKLERDGMFTLISYKHKFEGRESFIAIEPVIIMGQLNVDWPHKVEKFNEPEGWDRTKTTVALITDIYQNVKLKTEYYMNGEDTASDPTTGEDSVDNDEWLIQLEIKF